MIHSGLVSITFRQLSPQEIIDLVTQAGLEGIEWGGDVHAPHGDVARARQVRQWTEDAGLVTPSYGSYYRVNSEDSPPFEAVLDSAVALGAPIVRVWAGKIGSDKADEQFRHAVVDESRRIADLAQQANVIVAYEFHGNTLTDTNESALQLLQEVNHPNVKTYWQPMRAAEEQYRLDGLRAVLPWLTYLHVFSWEQDGSRLPLAAGQRQWQERIEIVQGTGHEHYALIEFVQDNAPEAFLDDAATLKQWLS
ncbi:MAG: sugar phosphate isomerase/epimerase [Anaerolineae bacterium]|nr:sugar phosphate isomerase/epimerase [Anaerolineae bacterium]